MPGKTFASSGNTRGGDVSSPEPSTDAFSDVIALVTVVSEDVVWFFAIVSLNEDVKAGVISMSCDGLSDNGICAADKITVNRIANVIFYQLVDVITFDKTAETNFTRSKWKNKCLKRYYNEIS